MITTGIELASAAAFVAEKCKTLYVMGCFGAPMTATAKKRYTSNHSYNTTSDRKKMIQAADNKTFGFDCVCLIKGLLWGWNGDHKKTYGGAVYNSNNVPDIGADAMFRACTEQSRDFSKIEIGEAVWMSGHIGVYIGNGLAVECSPKWKNGVQITACNRSVAGYKRRNWTKHGKLPYVEYSVDTVEKLENTIVLPTLRNGSKGNSVKAMQLILIGNKCSCGSYGADGNFGSATENAVMMFQDKNGLPVTGKCDLDTWEKLLK